MEIVIVLIVVGLLVILGLGLYIGRGRNDGADRPTSAGPPARPAGGPAATSAAASGTAVLEPPDLSPTDDRGELGDDRGDRDDDSLLAGPAVETLERPSFRDRLAKARTTLSGYVGGILSRGVDQQTWDDLEEALIRADVGVGLTGEIIEAVRTETAAGNVTDPAAVMELLKSEIERRLDGFDRSLHLASESPSVWLFVGVNGVGKTTTIGKLARLQIDDGRTVVLAAGDTFRAAAAEQLALWAERSNVGFIRGAEGSDPSAVVFDAVEHARARGADLVLADTAGRLHTKSNLMEELRKVRRVAEKGSGTVTEVLLVLDATTGQNGLVQAREFTNAVEVTGVVLTKLDGSAKGGIVLAIQQELGIPVKLVGLGEAIGDLVEFDPHEFVEALFS